MDAGQEAPQFGVGETATETLEARVSRLERELEALRRQVSAARPVSPAVARVPVEALAVPPPPFPASSPAPPPRPPRSDASTRWADPVLFPPEQDPQPRPSLENTLGSQIFNRIAILLLLVGTALFLKLAMDRQWVGATGRVVVGLGAGAALVLWSERFRARGFAAFSYSMKALGSGVLYLSLWASFQLYHLLPAGMALALMLLVTAWNAFMASAQNSELLGAYALAGGFATPLLLSTGGNHETFLFTYLLGIDIAALMLVRLKTWPRLLLSAFPLTVAYFIGWYASWWTPAALGTTSAFIMLFGLLFASVAIRRTPIKLVGPRKLLPNTLIEEIAVPLANAAFLALAGYSVLQDSGHHALLPWLMVALAGLYLALMRTPQMRTALAVHLSIAVALLTVAVPLKASGHWITASWLVEGLALLWASSRLEQPLGLQVAKIHNDAEAVAAATLRTLGVAALGLGFLGVVYHSVDAGFAASLPLFGADTWTKLTGVLVFAATAWLALRMGGEPESEGWGKIAMAAIFGIDLTAMLLAMRELLDAGTSGAHPPFRSADFVLGLVALGTFAGVVAVSMRLRREYAELPFWGMCASVSAIAFNLVAVLSGVREIDAQWHGSAQVALQQALAISAFLMAYGAALLAVGFWRRTAFLRWQALLLLVFTVFKAFLYDMRNLSQGYRVASFLGLGALLMTISFAYQKDWLALRTVDSVNGTADRTGAAR